MLDDSFQLTVWPIQYSLAASFKNITKSLGQLPVAETLVIALSCSYAWQDGFNIAEGGAITDDMNKKKKLRTGKTGGVADTPKVNIMVRFSRMRDNMEKSREDIEGRSSLIRGLEEGAQACEEGDALLEKASKEWGQTLSEKLRMHEIWKEMNALATILERL
ncbi:uncharacterized protein CCOS01_02173 [Colletotrichum costaricense]|uniref:Uncharacterized protein n=1 Tax=Colletotrichum costaricense TaxID=1209916 RepID=A0AAI9Z8W0_9PEZI|nr:uncharacterized protein CCOS01_02173 [Colletotrichum costaricense]KAK1536853.1 hypothetical protein CCOS01_02173 [Colletotrichum costaricense]